MFSGPYWKLTLVKHVVIWACVATINNKNDFILEMKNINYSSLSSLVATDYFCLLLLHHIYIILWVVNWWWHVRWRAFHWRWTEDRGWAGNGRRANNWRWANNGRRANNGRWANNRWWANKWWGNFTLWWLFIADTTIVLDILILLIAFSTILLALTLG